MVIFHLYSRNLIYSCFHKYVPIGRSMRQCKIPPGPPFVKGGNAFTPALLIVAIGVLNQLQAFMSSPFDKGGQGDLLKRQIGTYF